LNTFSRNNYNQLVNVRFVVELHISKYSTSDKITVSWEPLGSVDKFQTMRRHPRRTQIRSVQHEKGCMSSFWLNRWKHCKYL